MTPTTDIRERVRRAIARHDEEPQAADEHGDGIIIAVTEVFLAALLLAVVAVTAVAAAHAVIR